MSAYQVGSDAVEPGPRISKLRPIRGPTLEGDHEELAQKVVGQVAQPSAQEPVQLQSMPLEELTECLRPLERRRDHRVVVKGRVQRALRGWTQGMGVSSHAQFIAPGPKSVREKPSTAAIRAVAVPPEDRLAANGCRRMPGATFLLLAPEQGKDLGAQPSTEQRRTLVLIGMPVGRGLLFVEKGARTLLYVREPTGRLLPNGGMDMAASRAQIHTRRKEPDQPKRESAEPLETRSDERSASGDASCRPGVP